MTNLTLIHVLISLIGIASGFIVMFGFLVAKRFDKWTALFLSMTVATSVTGFMLPAEHFMPSHAFGIISLVVLAAAIYALYWRGLAGAWRSIYVIASITALYLNVFVLIVQLFQKIPALAGLAPTQSEPPFAITQLAVLVGFIGAGYLAMHRYQNDQLAVSR